MIKDHTGKEYDCIADLCSAWGINYANYAWRKKIGWGMEKILTTPIRKHNKKDGSIGSYELLRSLGLARYKPTFDRCLKRGMDRNQAIEHIKTMIQNRMNRYKKELGYEEKN